MELLRVREHGRIYVDKNGMYPLYRIAEVLLSSKAVSYTHLTLPTNSRV